MRTARCFGLLAVLCLTTSCSSGSSGLGSLGGLFNSGALSEQNIIAGLKEALQVGTRKAVDALSKPGGYAENASLRITLPQQFETVVSTLRKVGMGAQVDLLERKMNEAAERAAAEAAPVFLDAITQMSFADARKILSSENKTAATEYFREKTLTPLTQKYAPIVREKMNQVGTVQQYNTLMDRYNAIPLAPKVELSLDSYVTEKALEGLFSTLGEVEKDIRTNPAARTTELLQKVFAKQGS